MPRPYNWIKGEGTTKLQRWGLGSIMDTPFLPGLGEITQAELDAGGITPAAVAELNQASGPDMNNSFSSYGIYQNPPQVLSRSIGQWVTANAGLLLAGGIVGLLLFRRR